jgi:hypothetical protein
MMLADLPVEHPLRNTALVEIGARYKHHSAKLWSEVKPSFGIADKTFNMLGPAWTQYDDWQANKTGV